VPRPRPLPNPERTLIARLSGRPGRIGVVDKVRQIATNLGARPLRVFLVWTAWTGERRGEGEERLLAERELLPTPVVSDPTAVLRNPFAAGTLPVGTVTVTEISTGQYAEDELRGWKLPDGSPLDEAVMDFFYEVREDGRTAGRAPERRRYRVLGDVYLDAENVQWRVLLERASPDRRRDGSPHGGAPPPFPIPGD
jgi:hypothetical protein